MLYRETMSVSPMLVRAGASSFDRLIPWRITLIASLLVAAEYRTIAGVSGPLVVAENIKVTGPPL